MEYIHHLSKDRQLKKLIDAHGPVQLKKEKNICLYLCYSIMSQQLSTNVARVFHRRFNELYGKKQPTALQISNTPFETLRSIGLSNAKSQYVLNVAQFEREHGMAAGKLNSLSNDEIIQYLTQIKGVGRWTVEMLMMFALGREDVFAVDDLGIQQAMIHLYKLNPGDKKLLREQMINKSSRWAPYRTYACLHLWQFKDLIKRTNNADHT